MSCKSILIVEDDEDIRKQVLKALKGEGYHTLVAENGRRALEVLKSLPSEELPGCMILDLMMPEMDGKTLMEIIERDYKSEFGKIKVLVATAKGSPVDPQSVPQAVQRIQKPFDLDELFREIEKHCGRP